MDTPKNQGVGPSGSERQAFKEIISSTWTGLGATIPLKTSRKHLFKKLANLAENKEIPEKLIPVADKLRVFRNVGAHVALGELTENEVPILDNLSRAILE